MLRLRYSSDAKEDLKQIARYIAQDKPVAARQWVAKIRKKCRLVAEHPEIGDDRSELGENLRSTYVGSYVVFYQRTEAFLDIVRLMRGDRDIQNL